MKYLNYLHIQINIMGCSQLKSPIKSPVHIFSNTQFQLIKALYQPVQYICIIPSQFIQKYKYLMDILQSLYQAVIFNNETEYMSYIQNNSNKLFRSIIFDDIQLDMKSKIQIPKNLNRIYLVKNNHKKMDDTQQIIKYLPEDQQKITNELQYQYCYGLSQVHFKNYTDIKPEDQVQKKQNLRKLLSIDQFQNKENLMNLQKLIKQLKKIPSKNHVLPSFNINGDIHLVLDCYKNHSEIFEVMNKILKMNKSLQYIKFPFACFYNTIRSEYNRSPKLNLQVYQYIAYNIDQLNLFKNNIQKQITSTCFLTASKRKKQNSLEIQIIIQINSNQTNDYGFIDIQKYKITLQNQIIFNPFNRFYVKQVSQRSSRRIKIFLVYNKHKKEEITVQAQDDKNQEQTDLWILKPSRDVIKNFYLNHNFIWISQDVNFVQNQHIVEQISKYYKINLCEKLENALTIIKSQNDQIFRVITSASLGETVCKVLSKQNNVAHIYIFCEYLPAGEYIQSRYNKVKLVSNTIGDLLQKIKNLQKEDNKFKVLPIFAKTNEDKTKINKLRYNLHGLLRMKNKVNAKNDFIKLAEQLYPSQKQTYIQEFLTSYNHQMEVQDIIHWYTKQCFFYKLLNNLLRLSDDPLETAYLRLPFSDLFNSIKSIYQDFRQEDLKRVYKGGWLSDHDIKFIIDNIGNLIEILGFLSTSKNQQMARGFIKNSFFIIQIQDNKRHTEMDYGYASIEKYSKYPYEEEVLFNALNVFQIKKYEYIDGIHVITLKYGQLAEIFYKFTGNQKLTKNQQIEVYNYQHQKEKILSFINCQGNILTECQKYDDAIKFYERQLALLTQNNPQSSSKLSNVYYEIARNYDLIGQHNKALQLYLKSMNIKINSEQENSLEIASCYNNIGQIYRIKGNYPQALKYHNKSLKIRTKKFNENKSSVATTYNNIGFVYYSKGDNQKALQYYFNSLKIRLSIFGRYNSAIATSYNNIGSVYSIKGNYEKALQYYSQALKIDIITLGQNHLLTATSYNNIATIYKNKGDLDIALEYNFKSLNIKIKILGQSNSEIGSSYNNIGEVYRLKCEYDKSLQYHFKCLSIYQHEPSNSSSIATSYNNIGLVYDSKGNYQEALEYHQKSLRLRKLILGENNVDTATSYNNIGLVYYNKKCHEKALENYLKSLEIKLSVLGQNSHSTATSYNNIGSVYDAKGEYDKALENHFKSLQIRLNIFGEQHISTSSSYNNIGSVYKTKGEYSKSLEYHLKSLNIKLKILGEDNFETASSYNNIGLVYYNQIQYDKALEYYQKSLKIKLQKLGQDHPSTALSYYNIGYAYRSDKNFSKAIEWFEKCLIVRKKLYGSEHNKTKDVLKVIEKCRKDQEK